MATHSPIATERPRTKARPRIAPPRASARSMPARLQQVPVPKAIKPPVDEAAIDHRNFRQDAFWKRIPAFSRMTDEQFTDMDFQVTRSVTTYEELEALIDGVVDRDFLDDVKEGLRIAPMVMRISPYLLSLIDWDHPYEDPIRVQFLPVASRKEKDHPMLRLDSLREQRDSPVPGLVHRYPDKVLFLTLDVCPVYCRFCTRSYAIGQNTGSVEKAGIKATTQRWNQAFAYIASRPEVEDVVISGGDAYMLPPVQIRHIGQTLLDIPHVRRIRYATKGLAVLPMKVLRDNKWREAMVDVTALGRERAKEVCIHTHFNSLNEITDISRQAAEALFQGGVKVRNQAVLIRGVNDSPEHLVKLMRKLSYMNIQPYYVYQHDMVKGVEDLRTATRETRELERQVRGTLAGFNTPVFVADVPGGGGKRDVHSQDDYDPTTGVSVYRSPGVNREAVYFYFDPLSRLPEEGRRRWDEPDAHKAIIRESLERAGLEDMRVQW